MSLLELTPSSAPTVGPNWNLLIGLAGGWATAALAALARIAYLMGTVATRLQDLERRADGWDQAISNGYEPRPRERR